MIMIIILTLVVLILVTRILIKWMGCIPNGVYDEISQYGGSTIFMLRIINWGMMVVLLLVLLSIPITHISINTSMEEISGFKSGIAQFRETHGRIPPDSPVHYRIVDMNNRIFRLKYYNSTILGLWIPDEVEGLEMIDH